MLNVKNHPVKTLPSEMTLGEFERVSHILRNNDVDNIDKYIHVFNVLGLPMEIIDGLELDEFIDIINEWRKHSQTEIDDTLTPSVEINGDLYIAHDGVMKWRVPDLRLIEKAAKDSATSAGMIISIIFKKDGLSKNEHQDINHLKHKAKLFREHFPANLAIPYLIEVSKRLVSAVKINTPAPSESEPQMSIVDNNEVAE